MIITARVNLIICLTIAVGIFSFTIADEAWGLLALGMIGSLIGYIAGRPDPEKFAQSPRPWALPRAAVNILVFLAILNAFLQASIFRDGQRPLVSTLGTFLVHVQLVKLVDRRTARDEAQLLGLSLFGVIAAILTSNSLPLGIALTVYTPLIVTSAMLTEINSASTTGIAHAAITARTLFHQLRRVVGMSVLAACALAAGVFILTPRGIGSDLLGALGKPGQAQIGFTDDARLGASGFLNESQIPVLDLSVTDGDGLNIGDSSRPVYLRGAVRDLYLDRGQWVSELDISVVRTESVSAGEQVALGPGVTDRTLTIQHIIPRGARREGEDYFFHVWRPVWISSASESGLKRSPIDLSMRRAGKNRSAGRGEYTVASLPNDLSSAGYEPRVPTTFRQGPIADFTRTLLDDLAATGSEPDEQLDEAQRSFRRRRDATQIRDHLQRNFAYTLEMVAPKEGQDPIQMFLFDTKRGHCEYFASAMVAMCQSADIPARLVLGYVATDFSPFTSQYTVRESNAHAWVEVCVGQGRWITLDPSPPGDIERIHRPPTGLLSRIRSLYELLEFNWNESIIGFDRSRQTRMLGGEAQNRRGFSEFAASLQDAWVQLWRFIGMPGEMGVGAEFFRLVSWWVGLTVLITLTIWIIWRKRRSVLFRRLAHGDLDPELRGLLSQSGFYRRALKVMRRAGAEKPRSRSPLDHARSIRRRNPEIAASFATIARHYYTLRFARRKLSDADLADAAAALRVIETVSVRKSPTTAPGPTGDR